MAKFFDPDGLRPTYSAEVQAQLDGVEDHYQGQKNSLEDQHRILGAQVKKGAKKGIPEEELRAFEREIFDRQIKILSEARHGDKREILKRAEER